MSGPETYKLAKKLPDYGIYGLVYLSGSSILYGNEFFSKGAPSISIDIVAYSIMLGSLLSFLSVYLLHMFLNPGFYKMLFPFFRKN